TALLLSHHPHHRDLHSFPTRRSSDLFAICKGMQLFNVALGGTLHLDIPGHNAPEMKDHNIQPLRTDAAATHRLEKVNSSHHQARSEEHTSELQSPCNLVCRLLLEKKN